MGLMSTTGIFMAWFDCILSLQMQSSKGNVVSEKNGLEENGRSDMLFISIIFTNHKLPRSVKTVLSTISSKVTCQLGFMAARVLKLQLQLQNFSDLNSVLHLCNCRQLKTLQFSIDGALNQQLVSKR
jgi:hypothetical protein